MKLNRAAAPETRPAGRSAGPQLDGEWGQRVRIDRFLDPSPRARLAEDVRIGLTRVQKTLPPKYFYDDYGSRLFDAICDLPEYYLTRAEQAILETVRGEIVAAARPTHLIELGSGVSRKTRLLLDELVRVRPDACYVPMDVNESVLRQSAADLCRAYPRLRVHGIVADYEHHLERIPAGERRLVIFLGSTIGNFSRDEAMPFLRALARQLAPGDFLLIGMDLLKPVEALHAAYNDRAGVTAEFNRNVLRVLNRELDAEFELDRFEHVAFFDRTAAQVEMHLRAREAHEVRIRALGLSVPFVTGETIRTEISRKFTRADADALLAAAGCRMIRWYTSAGEAFGLAFGAVDDRR